MKKLSFKIASLLMAFTMLFSTLSFSVDKHYCGGQLFSESVFSHAKDCGMQQSVVCGDKNLYSLNIKDNSCCHNVHIIIKGQPLEQKALTATSLDIQKIVVVVNFRSFNIESYYHQQHIFYQNYLPPLLVKDIPILVQSFLI